MTTFPDIRNNLWNEETLMELEYLIGDFLVSTGFSFLSTAIGIWLFLRLYWFGISLIGRFMGHDVG